MSPSTTDPEGQWKAYYERWSRLPESERMAEWAKLSPKQQGLMRAIADQVPAKRKAQRKKVVITVAGCGCAGLLSAGVALVSIPLVSSFSEAIAKGRSDSERRAREDRFAATLDSPLGKEVSARCAEALEHLVTDRHLGAVVTVDSISWRRLSTDQQRACGEVWSALAARQSGGEERAEIESSDRLVRSAFWDGSLRSAKDEYAARAAHVEAASRGLLESLGIELQGLAFVGRGHLRIYSKGGAPPSFFQDAFVRDELEDIFPAIRTLVESVPAIQSIDLQIRSPDTHWNYETFSYFQFKIDADDLLEIPASDVRRFSVAVADRYLTYINSTSDYGLERGWNKRLEYELLRQEQGH